MRKSLVCVANRMSEGVELARREAPLPIAFHATVYTYPAVFALHGSGGARGVREVFDVLRTQLRDTGRAGPGGPAGDPGGVRSVVDGPADSAADGDGVAVDGASPGRGEEGDNVGDFAGIDETAQGIEGSEVDLDLGLAEA